MFFIQFPGYFFYHYFAAAGMIPLFIRGWFILATGASVIMLSLPFLLREPGRGRQLVIHIALAIMCAILVIYGAGYYFWGNDWQRAPALALYTIVLLPNWLGIYLLGYLIDDSPAFRKMFLFSLVGMTGLSIASIDPVSVQFIATNRFSAPEGAAGYQGFALAFTTVALLGLATTRGHVQILVLAAAATVLLILGSRSDFYGFLYVLCVWAAVTGVRRHYIHLGAGLAAVAASWGLLIFTTLLISQGPGAVLSKLAYLDRAPQMGLKPEPPSTSSPSAPAMEPPAIAAPTPQSKVFVPKSDYELDIGRQATVFELEKSESWGQRTMALRNGWEDIKSSPIFGVYGGQTKNEGQIGLYIHNALSAWQQYGIVTFFIYLALCISAPAIAAYQVLWHKSDDALWIATLYIGSFTLLLIVVAKAVFWPLPALAWGLLASCLSRENRQSIAKRRGECGGTSV